MSDKVITYMQVLLNSLEKKKELLKDIVEITTRQETLLNMSKFDMDSFEITLSEKESRIESLKLLDSGFENVYDRVKEEMTANRYKHQSFILKIQGLIAELTDLSVKIQAMEERNKSKMQICFANQRQQIKEFKMSNQTALNYYKNMSNQHQGQSYFLDKKK